MERRLHRVLQQRGLAGRLRPQFPGKGDESEHGQSRESPRFRVVRRRQRGVILADFGPIIGEPFRGLAEIHLRQTGHADSGD